MATLNVDTRVLNGAIGGAIGGSHIPGQPFSAQPTAAPGIAPTSVGESLPLNNGVGASLPINNGIGAAMPMSPPPAPTQPPSQQHGQLTLGDAIVHPLSQFVAGLFGGGDSKPAAPATADTTTPKYIQMLTAAGYAPEHAHAILDQYNQSIAKQNALKKLPPGFADIIKNFDASQASASAPQSQRIMDPLAMQLFFNQTVAPYMQSIANNSARTQSTLGAALAPYQANTPPAYRALLSQAVPAAQAQAANLQNAAQMTATAGPVVNQLQAQLSAAWQAQKMAQYFAEKNIAYSNGANPAAGGAIPSAEEIAAALNAGS